MFYLLLFSVFFGYACEAKTFGILSKEFEDAAKTIHNVDAQKAADAMINKINGRSGNIKKNLAKGKTRELYFESMMRLSIAYTDPKNLKTRQEKRACGINWDRVVTDFETYVLRYGEKVDDSLTGHLCGLLTAMVAGAYKANHLADVTDKEIEKIAETISADYDHLKVGRSIAISRALARVDASVIKKFLSKDDAFKNAWGNLSKKLPKDQRWIKKQKDEDPRVVKALDKSYDGVIQINFLNPSSIQAKAEKTAGGVAYSFRTGQVGSGSGAIGKIGGKRILLSTAHTQNGTHDFAYVRLNNQENSDYTRIFDFVNIPDRLMKPFKDKLHEQNVKHNLNDDQIRSFIGKQWEVDVSYALCHDDFEPATAGYDIVAKDFKKGDVNVTFYHIGYGTTEELFEDVIINDNKRRYYSGLIHHQDKCAEGETCTSIIYVPKSLIELSKRTKISRDDPSLPVTGFESSPNKGNSGGPFFNDKGKIFGVLKQGGGGRLWKKEPIVIHETGEVIYFEEEDQFDTSGINPISSVIYDLMEETIKYLKRRPRIEGNYGIYTFDYLSMKSVNNDHRIDEAFKSALDQLIKEDGWGNVLKSFKNFKG